jgi:uncharacterized integral membrane protein
VEQSQPDKRKAKRWLLIAAGVILLLMLLLNSEKVELHFILGSAEMPLFLALAIAAALGALVGWAAPRLRRHRD